MKREYTITPVKWTNISYYKSECITIKVSPIGDFDVYMNYGITDKNEKIVKVAISHGESYDSECITFHFIMTQTEWKQLNLKSFVIATVFAHKAGLNTGREQGKRELQNNIKSLLNS